KNGLSSQHYLRINS
ncbi:ompA family protein, partial [Vibrio harveyi]